MTPFSDTDDSLDERDVARDLDDDGDVAEDDDEGEDLFGQNLEECVLKPCLLDFLVLKRAFSPGITPPMSSLTATPMQISMTRMILMLWIHALDAQPKRR
jgi:hypothetical protein